MPIGDVQAGVPGCDEDKLRKHIEWGLEHNAYFIGMGDYVDMASPSDRRRLRSVEFYDPVTLAIQEKAEADVERFLSLVEGSSGRWLGILEGHHYMEFPDGTTSDLRISKALAAPFLGDMAIVTVHLADKKRKLSVPAKIWAFHGEGSTSTEAGVITQLLRHKAAWEADVYLLGHHHKKVATKKPRGESDEADNLRMPEAILAGTGSFLRGHMQDSRVDGRPGGAYPEQKGMPPVALGGVLIYMRPAVREDGSARLDLNVSL